MKNSTWTWIAVVGLILFGAFLFWGAQKIFTPEKPKVRSDTIVITKLDTVKYAVKTFVYSGKTVKTDTIIVNHHDTSYIARQFEKSNDTIWVYNQYYSTQKDSIILTDNPDLWFRLNFGISENRLIRADGKYVIKRATQQINNNPIQPLTRQLYIGGRIGSDLSNVYQFGAILTLKNKKDQLYGIGIDFIPSIDMKPIFSIHHSIKIKL